MADNDEQQAYWNGPGGERWVAHQQALDAMVRPFGEAAMARLELQPGEHVLDVGCGCGDTVLALERQVGERGTVTGVDLSAPMLARARERTTRATLIAADATAHAFGRRFDALFSRFGVMFFADPPAAFTVLRGLLSDRPVGRMAFACWRSQAENTWASVPAAAVRAALPALKDGVMDRATGPGPFALADRDHVARVLGAAGFTDVDIAPFEHEVELGATGLTEATRFAVTAGPAARLLVDATPDQRERAVQSVRDALAPHLRGERVVLHGSVWVVLARR